MDKLGLCIYPNYNSNFKSAAVYTFMDKKYDVYLAIFDYSSSKYGEIIFKCAILDKNLDSKILNLHKNQIYEEYNLLKSQSKEKPKYFIKTFDFLEIQQNLDKNSRLNIEKGSYIMYGFTMEKMQKDLKALIEEKKFLNDFLIFMYLRKCLKVLCYMQDLSLCHRDIKPQNLFLDNEGKIRLGDLGSSKTFEKANKTYRKEFDYIEKQR